MKIITIISPKYGKFEIKVDDEDYDFLNNYKWYATHSHQNSWYTTTYYKNKRISMHRLIMNVTDSKILIDHIDGNPLNNQRNNLRIATSSQNSQNKKPNYNALSKFKGVTRDKKRHSDGYNWVAGITNNGKTIRKYFSFDKKGEIEAAKYYDKMAKELFGEFAYLNFPN